jgi:N,N'-diacetylchitobiose transport system permease protein
MMTLPVWLRTFQQATRATDSAVIAASTPTTIPARVLLSFVQGCMSEGVVCVAVNG